jgi:hypothetical protein
MSPGSNPVEAGRITELEIFLLLESLQDYEVGLARSDSREPLLASRHGQFTSFESVRIEDPQPGTVFPAGRVLS